MKIQAAFNTQFGEPITIYAAEINDTIVIVKKSAFTITLATPDVILLTNNQLINADAYFSGKEFQEALQAYQFLNQASRIPYSFTDVGTARYQIAKKEEMRKKGIKSPDLADAMSFAFLDGLYYNVSDAAFDVSGSLKKDDDLFAEALKELGLKDN